VADAARTLDRHGLWRWEVRPHLAIARSIEALAADPVDRVAIDRLRDRPELRSLPVRPETAAAIWARSDDSTRLELLPSLARLPAPIRRELLEGLARPDDPITATSPRLPASMSPGTSPAIPDGLVRCDASP
ncbi:MAG: hypothetical protein ACYTFH_02340, partial [Planctomycetota bacterium]|jgi:hypothetical protein